MSWFTRITGVDAVVEELAAERAERQALIREVLKITQMQTEAATKMAEAFQGMSQMFSSVGQPEVRAASAPDEEIVIWEFPKGPQGN